MSLVIVKSFCLLFNGQKYNTSNIDTNNNNTTSKPGHVCRINTNTYTHTYNLHITCIILWELSELSLHFIKTYNINNNNKTIIIIHYETGQFKLQMQKRSNIAKSITLFSGIGINMKPDRQTSKQSKALLLPLSIHNQHRKNTLKTQHSHYSKKQRNIKSIVFRWLNGMMKIIRKFSYS